MAGTCWTASDAGSIVAMIATLGAQFNVNIRIGTNNGFTNPVPAITYGNIILSLAGNHTVAASYTLACIYSHCIPHALASFPGFSVINVTKFPLIPVPPITGSTITFVIISVSLTPLPYAYFSGG